ncbi:MAG: hypothetical protein WBZ22_24305, partial [Pseudolabrys sp.]
QDRERPHIAGDGKFDRRHIHPRFVDFTVGELLSPTLVRGGHWLLRQSLLAAGVLPFPPSPPHRLDDESKFFRHGRDYSPEHGH